jgi:26S proteasome non-ATPase regulatory subunit 9
VFSDCATIKPLTIDTTSTLEKMDQVAALTRRSLETLDVKRKALESEAEAITLELTAQTESGGPPMGIDTPLVDSDGYPRADIDLYRAKSLRGRLAEIRTDHKDLMTHIEEALSRYAAMKNPGKEEEEKEEFAARYAPKPKPKYDPITKKWVVMNWDGTVAGVEKGEQLSFDDVGKESNSATGQVADVVLPTYNTPFARVDSVAAHSPAEQAGLKEGDLIVEFGYVNYMNHEHLQAIADVVPTAASDQKPILIKLLRQQEEQLGSDGEQVVLSISLVPQPWSGRGLIGCHIVPYSG